jgi:uncharacterized membrane protein
MWTALVGAAAVWRHDQFLSHRFDLGNMVQAVWSTTQGHPLEMTDAATGEQITRLGAHVDPILVFFAPLWLIHPDPTTLIVAQAAMLASGIYPVVRLALKYTESALATSLLGAWYLVFPWVVWNAFDEVHPVTLAIPLLLYAIWFLDEHRLWPFGIAAVLALLTGELVGLTVAGLGLWYAIRYRRYRAGATIAVIGVAWTAACFALVVPAFNGGASSRYYERFETVGGSPTGVLSTLVNDPGQILGELTGRSDLLYVLLLLLPTAFLALIAPIVLVAALPQLGVNLIAAWSVAALPMFHYAATIIPILIAASIMATARFPARGRVLASAIALGAATLILVSYPPVPGSQVFVFPDAYPATHRAALEDAVEMVPSTASVTATNRLGAHLSARRIIQLFPETSGTEWAAIDTHNPWLPGRGESDANLRVFLRAVGTLASDPAWRLRFERDGVRVYERVR